MAAPKQGGFKMSLGGLKGKPGTKPAPAQTDAKRSRLALLGDDDPDDSNKQQEIAGWDVAAGGAVDIAGKKEKTPPRVIPALPNRNWREAAQRRRGLAKAPHTQAQNATNENAKEPEVQFGLTIISKDKMQDDSGEEVASGEPMEDVQDNLTDAQRLEKRAMEALLNGKSNDDELVIPVQSEEEAFRKDLQDAPDAPTLAAYEATPIEGFGAALLRGMGWKGEDATSKNGPLQKAKEVKRRPALLGIGAKEEAAVGVELGEWSKKGKGRKAVQGYNPVALRNKKTGELITEEELKVKLEQQDLVKDEKPSRERRKYSDDEGRDKRREKRDDDYDSGSRRDRDRKDDRRREKDDYYDSDRKRDRKDKYRDEEYDSERRRDKRKGRDEDYDSERRREKRRDRSRSPDDHKRRDRYRSRSRDSRRDRDRRDRSRDDDRRKHRKDRNYDDDRGDRKRSSRDDKYYK